MFFENMFGSESFRGFGGMPGFRGSGGLDGEGSDDEPIDNQGYYKLLGVDKNASTKEIKKAFKKQAMTHHPDRGGDEEHFKKIEKAKEVLCDDDKRRAYDRFGEKGVEQGMGGGGGMGDIFDLFSGRSARQNKGPPKPKTIQLPIDIRLDDVYLGSAIKKTWKIMTATKRVTCQKCDGRGLVKYLIRQGAMMLQTQRKCEACGGRGFQLMDEREIEKTGTVHIPHGIKNGAKITLHGEGHHLPEYAKGDVVFIIRICKHKVYHRKGADLGCEQHLTLYQALCGYEFTLPHLSGKTLVIKSKPGETVAPGDLKKLKDFGLPQKGNHFVRGHLYIKFNIVFPLPKTLQEDQIKALEGALSNAKYPEVKREAELGRGSKVTVKLAANAAERIYGQRKEMHVNGIICDEKLEDRDAWPVELELPDATTKTVVVPAAWVEAADSSSRKNSTSSRSGGGRKKKKKKRKAKGSSHDDKAMDEDDADKEDECEEVFLIDIDGPPPTPTPASGGTAAQEEEEEAERNGGHGGVQCQQM